MNVKVMSYNIQAGKNDEDIEERSFDFSLDVIKSVGADIIGLNEVGRHAHGDRFPKLELGCEPYEYLGRRLGLNFSFAEAITTQDGCPYGNALLTRYKILSTERIFIPDPPRTEDKYYETRCILKAELDVAGGVTVLVTHFGTVESERVSAVEALMSLVPKIKTPVILMGDFNLTPDDPVLKPLYEILKDTNCGRSTPYSWPSNKAIHEKESRKIDYIFTSENISVLNFKVIETKASDHLPVIAEIEL